MTFSGRSKIKERMTIDAAPVRNHFQFLLDNGIPLHVLEDILDMTQSQLNEPDAVVPFLKNIKLLELGITRLRPDLALLLGRSISLETIGVCGFIFKNCRNIEEVTHQFIRYQRLLYSISHFKLSQRKESVAFLHSIPNPKYAKYIRLTTELGFSSIVTAIQALVGERGMHREIHFSYAQPPYVNSYRKIFQAELKFNQKENAVIFDPDQLALPIPENQPYVKDILVKHADKILKQSIDDRQLTNAVQRLIIANLPKGSVDIEMISGLLHMSRWTLSRKLKSEGVTFQYLLSEIRKELALAYLEDPTLSIGEIAFLVGYTEMSAFSRAFKSWTGKNPYHYRKYAVKTIVSFR